jgi:hypothetical protein
MASNPVVHGSRRGDTAVGVLNRFGCKNVFELLVEPVSVAPPRFKSKGRSGLKKCTKENC